MQKRPHYLIAASLLLLGCWNPEVLRGAENVMQPVAPNPPPAGQAAHTLDIYWIDMEGGSGTLIVTPAVVCGT